MQSFLIAFLNKEKYILTYYNSCSIFEVWKRWTMNNKNLNIKIPEALYNQLKEEANRKNISLAAIVRVICSEYFESKK